MEPSIVHVVLWWCHLLLQRLVVPSIVRVVFRWRGTWRKRWPQVPCRIPPKRSLPPACYCHQYCKIKPSNKTNSYCLTYWKIKTKPFTTSSSEISPWKHIFHTKFLSHIDFAFTWCEWNGPLSFTHPELKQPWQRCCFSNKCLRNLVINVEQKQLLFMAIWFYVEPFILHLNRHRGRHLLSPLLWFQFSSMSLSQYRTQTVWLHHWA